jgi:galactokinase/mevalonate kinase-like predicted kinase
MQKLLSLPPALAPHFATLTERQAPEWVASHDPVGSKLGSGGGTAHLLHDAWQQTAAHQPFSDWLASGGPRIVLHAGGQSRRLPAYAASGKSLIPVPVFRWSRGQRIDQTLLDLQLPLLERLLNRAPTRNACLIASGDVLVRSEVRLPDLPDVDVLCLGLWADPRQASHHGVFFAPRADPSHCAFMLQKPSHTAIGEHARDYLFLLDIGIWILSPRAIAVLMQKCGWNPASRTFTGGTPASYDLYGAFGPALGSHPQAVDPAVNALSCALLPLHNGEFYHFGTNAEIIESSLALQNRERDQRRIISPLIKPHPSIFVQNSVTGLRFTPDNEQIWVENACIPASWTLRQRHVLTGIPANAWTIDLPAGCCVDCAPLIGGRHVLRPYGMRDAFRGPAGDATTHWLEQPLAGWLAARRLSLATLGIDPATDIQDAPLFPVIDDLEAAGSLLQWLVAPQPTDNPVLAARYVSAPRLSAEQIASQADLPALCAQRQQRLIDSLPVLARHARRSVFYQVDLQHTARLLANAGQPLPECPAIDAGDTFTAIHDHMFRSEFRRLRGLDGAADAAAAFGAQRQAVLDLARNQPVEPRLQVLADQIIWGRSPVRWDLAGGWTDTPPYCFLEGGHVVNVAVELNGQPPIQVFARACADPHITVRSIDLGIATTLSSYQEIATCAEIGSGFAIAKAALALCGFHPDYRTGPAHPTLRDQLLHMGGGIELSLLAAVPKGSGLGTSSILAATILGVLNDLCQLGWSASTIGARTLALEQLLTSGGGWQDQFGGLFRGLKSLRTQPGFDQTPQVHWLPDHLLSDPTHKACTLLYYTGITRVAHSVLGEIVRGMFLNGGSHLSCLRDIRRNASVLSDAVLAADWAAYCACIRRSWLLNQQLDTGTNTPPVAALLASVDDLLAGMKLLGAGGGGYLLMLAKDPEAARRVRLTLEANPPNSGARFVDYAVSASGLQITRS